ncbi:MAG: NTP transferase domain-containing protein [Chloroflexi bacterium]|nr:NTP transferase domain-containing protein [Chloroflexota bacterium]
MGQAKALLDWGGVPLVVWQARSLISGGCEKVLVVTGAEHAAVGAALEGLPGVAALYNPDHRSGRSTSVRGGGRPPPPPSPPPNNTEPETPPQPPREVGKS